MKLSAKYPILFVFAAVLIGCAAPVSAEVPSKCSVVRSPEKWPQAVENPLFRLNGNTFGLDRENRLVSDRTLPVALPTRDFGWCLDAGSVYLIGGKDRDGLSRRVFSFDGAKLKRLPDLPEGLQSPSAAWYDGALYVAGGIAADGKLSNRMYSLKDERSDWVKHPNLPQGGLLKPVMAQAFNELIFIGGKTAAGPIAECWSYSVKFREGHKTTGFLRRKDAPFPVADVDHVRGGQSHLIFLNRNPAGKPELYAFHSFTNTYCPLGTLTLPGSAARMFADGEKIVLGDLQNRMFFRLEFGQAVKKLAFVDYAVIIAYFVLMIGIGAYFARRQKDTGSYAKGGGKVRWWAAAMSIMANGTSAVSFMAIPAMIASTSLVFTIGGLIWMLPATLIAAYITYPLFRRLNVTSTYEYLESRYGLTLRIIGSAMSIVYQIFGRMSLVILLPALAINAITGLDVVLCVFAMGLTTTIYASMGGFEAVVWNDVVQGALIMIGFGLIAALICFSLPDGFQSILEVGRAEDKFQLLMFDFDASLPIFWFGLVGLVVNSMSFASDQSAAQRVQSTPLKDVRKMAFMSSGLIFFLSFSVGLLGIGLMVFFHFHPELLAPVMKNDQLVPLFIAQRVPVGFAGMLIATLFAASISTIAGSVNACAVMTGTDFSKRLLKWDDHRCLIVMKSMSVISGIAGTLTAWYLVYSPTPGLMQLNLELGAIFGGGFAGVFVLGMFTRRTHELGAIIGVVFSGAATVLLKLSNTTALHWTAWGLLGVMVCIITGYLASLLIPAKKRNLIGLTIFDPVKK